MIGCNDLFRRSSEEEVDVKVAAGCYVAQYTRPIFIVRNHRRLSVRIPEVYAKEEVSLVRLDQAEWMHATLLLASSAVVVRWLLTAVPHGPCALGQRELSVPLAKTVDLLCHQLHVNLYELVLEYECLVPAVDEYFL